MKYPTHGASVRAALVHRFLKASRASVVFVTARGYESRQRGSIKSADQGEAGVRRCSVRLCAVQWFR